MSHLFRRTPQGILRLGVSVSLVALAMGLVGPRMSWAAVDFADAPLIELPQSGAPAREETTLRALARKYRGDYHADFLVVYGWGASSAWDPPVQRVFVDELRQIDELAWDRRLTTKMTPISIVTLEGAPSAATWESLCQAVQKAARGNQRMPTFVDKTGRFREAVAKALGGDARFFHTLFRVDCETLALEESRGDDPVRANTWLSLLDQPRSPVEGDPAGMPAGCEDSWFRRAIARVGTAVMEADPSVPFLTKGVVTDAEFVTWLAKLSPERAALALREIVREHPVTLTRERAITAAVRFLTSGASPAEAIRSCAPPAGGAVESTQAGGAAAEGAWLAALASLPGAGSVSDSLRLPISLALAKGLLCDEPSLHAQWPLTREYAAWLLDRARGGVAGGNTGVILDCIDLAAEPDALYGRGEVLIDEPTGPRTLYPAYPFTDRLPVMAAGYPPILYLAHRDVVQPQSREATWLAERTGPRPLVVRPLRVMGRNTLARRMVISAEDAERLVALNQEVGVLDAWRVAVITGVGAQLQQPIDQPLSRQGQLLVSFTTEMDPTTFTAKTIRLSRRDTGAAASARLTPRPGWPYEVSVEPDAPLDPGVVYDLVLGTGVRSVEGEPLSIRAGEALPEGVARRWTFTSENVVKAQLYFPGLPVGSKVYLHDTLLGATPFPAAVEVTVTPGSIALRAELPAGDSCTTALTVDHDGSYEVKLGPRKAARVTAKVDPAEMVVGGEAKLTFEVLGDDGNILRDHAPLQVRIVATGCRVAPSSTLSLAAGVGTLLLTSSRPGKVTLALTPSDPSVEVTPAALELYCKDLPHQAAPAWSPVESARLSGPREGTDVILSPRLRRWFARESDRQVRVVLRDGTSFRRVSQLPGREEFTVDGAGLLHFHRSAAGSVVDISYQYRNGRACALVVGPAGAEPLASTLQLALNAFLRDLGYVLVSPKDVLGVLESEELLETSSPRPSLAQALAVFALDDLFVVRLAPADNREWSLTLSVNSSAPGNLRPTAYLPSGVPPRFRADPKRPGALSGEDCSQLIQRVLSEWCDNVGLQPSQESAGGRR